MISSTALPLVSTIIPCYNHGKFIREAIDSVLSQTHAAIEIIVIDDGSTDHTSTIAQSFSQVQYIRQENQGVTIARNVGLQHSTGDYVLFLDADDRLLPHAVETGLKILIRDSNCALTFGTFYSIDTNGRRIGTAYPLSVRSYGYRDFLARNLIGNPGVAIYRKAPLIEIDGFDPWNEAAGDYDLYLRIASLYPISCHDEQILEYRRHGSNMSDDPALMLAACLQALRRQWKIVKGNPILEAAYERGVAFWKAEYGEPLIRRMHNEVLEGRWFSGFRCLSRLMRHYPDRFVQCAKNKMSAAKIKI